MYGSTCTTPSGGFQFCPSRFKGCIFFTQSQVRGYRCMSCKSYTLRSLPRHADVFFDVFTFRSAVKPCRSANSHITQSHCEHVQLHRASILVLKTPHTRWSAFLLSLPCPISVKSGPNSSLKVLCNYRGF